ncbi:MarR family winged helix-turn-helix transcriptional regulator [Caldiplasma sukawensis]
MEDSERFTSLWRNFISIYKMLYRAVEKTFSKYDVSVLEYRILRILDENKKMTMANLAEINYVTQAWITGMIDKMESKNLVKRVRSEKDRRVIYIQNTEEGTKTFKSMKKVHDLILQELLSKIDEKDVDELLRITTTLKLEMEKLGTTPQ